MLFANTTAQNNIVTIPDDEIWRRVAEYANYVHEMKSYTGRELFYLGEIHAALLPTQKSVK